jgi:hypothetical protein
MYTWLVLIACARTHVVPSASWVVNPIKYCYETLSILEIDERSIIESISFRRIGISRYEYTYVAAAPKLKLCTHMYASDGQIDRIFQTIHV